MSAAIHWTDQTIRQAFAMVASTDWRGPISRWVSDAELKHAGISVDTIARAVFYYTATEATVTRCRGPLQANGRRSLGYQVKAVGYRNGPAGP